MVEKHNREFGGNDFVSGKKEPLWTKNYIMHLVAYFFVFVVFYLYMIFTTQMAMKNFGAGVNQAGFASSIFIISALVARIFAGKYLEQVGRRKMMLISAAVYGICTLCYHIVGGMSGLFALRLIHGIAFGCVATVFGAVSVDIIPVSRRGEGLGYFSLSMTMGAAIGPFLGVVLPQINPLYAMVVSDIIAVVLMLMVMVLHVPELDEKLKARLLAHQGWSISSFIEPKALGIAVVAMLSAVGYSGVMSYIGAYSEAIGLLLGGSLFYVVYSVTCLISRPLSGMALDRWGNNVVMLPVLFCMIFGFLAVAEAESNAMLLLGAALVAIGYGTVPPAGQAIAVQNVTPDRYSLATSTLYIALDAGNGIGSAVLGNIVPIYGFRALYLCSSIAAACAFVFYVCMVLHKRHLATK